MKRILSVALFVLLVLSPVFAAQDLRFSTAGFWKLPDTGREVYSMNPAWRFFKGNVDGAFEADFDDSGWDCVSLPHGIEYLPVEASGCINYQGVVWYRKHFTPGEELKGKKLFLHFEAIMGKCKVWVNGRQVTEHFGGYLPVIADISDALEWGQDNVIAVMADNSDDPDYPVGKPQETLDYAYFGGIYRDCWLVAHNDIHITDPNYEDEVAGGGVYLYSENVSETGADLNIKTHVRNESARNAGVTVLYELRDAEGAVVAKHSGKLSLKASAAGYISGRLHVKNPALWSPETPYLYNLDIFVKDGKGKVIDGMRQRVGIRSIEFRQEQGLWINGKPYGKIMGGNRHQDFAVIGNAVPNSIQWRDARKLKDAGMKIIRSAHYVLDPSFMDACDELGLFVMVATPGWQFWNGKGPFGERVYSDIRNMIRQNRNRPSTFLWEPILNETSYPAEFAKNAADICRAEYPYVEASCDDAAKGDENFTILLRPTHNFKPGRTYLVREWGSNPDDWSAQNSNNRISRDWGEVAMLVQADHLEKTYAKVYSDDPRVVGGCLWESFDHNRGYHPDPGYNGIMDLFRQPKTSYYMYMAQRPVTKYDFNAESGPMIYVASEMTPLSPSDVTVYSNCEEVRLTVYKDGEVFTLKQKADRKYPSPKFVFKNAYDFQASQKPARENRHDDRYLLAEGLIDGKVVVTHKRTIAERPAQIRLRLDNNGTSTVADGSDMVTVIAEMVDKKGVVKRLNNSIIRFSIEGEGRLIGETVCALRWGSTPILIQSTLNPGKVKVSASMVYEGSQRPLSGELEFETVADPNLRIYSESESKFLDVKKEETAVRSAVSKSELEKENERLRQQLNEYRVKEVGEQQTLFGKGINDGQ